MKLAKPAAISAATVAAVAGVLALNPSPSSVAARSTSTASGQAAGTDATSGTTTTSETTTTSGTTGTSGTKTVTGTAASSPYGDMQVKATITNGRITDITWVQLPGDGHSMRINNYAAPLLVQEALQAQSYQVDAVSGATYTSQGFKKSLQSALTKANFTV